MTPHPTLALLLSFVSGVCLALAVSLTIAVQVGMPAAPSVSIGDHVLGGPLSCEEDEYVDTVPQGAGSVGWACVHLVEAWDAQGVPYPLGTPEWVQQAPDTP